MIHFMDRGLKMTPILYILMRTDLPSMNPGKAIAQGSHAANQFVYTMNTLNIHKNLENMFNIWQSETNKGFGTVLVLGATKDQIDFTFGEIDDTKVNSTNCLSDWVVDPTYPFITNEEIYKLLVSNSNITGQKLDNGNYVCFREEKTCAYIFSDKDTISPFLSHLNLHP